MKKTNIAVINNIKIQTETIAYIETTGIFQFEAFSKKALTEMIQHEDTPTKLREVYTHALQMIEDAS